MNAFKTTSLLVATLCGVCVNMASAADEAVPTSSLTRAEVLADLEVWQLAGMPSFHRGDAGPDMGTAEYTAALAKYHAMRASPDFEQRVIRIARQRGERVHIAAK